MANIILKMYSGNLITVPDIAASELGGHGGWLLRISSSRLQCPRISIQPHSGALENIIGVISGPKTQPLSDIIYIVYGNIWVTISQKVKFLLKEK